jgi:hypothetical protein
MMLAMPYGQRAASVGVGVAGALYDIGEGWEEGEPTIYYLPIVRVKHAAR